MFGSKTRSLFFVAVLALPLGACVTAQRSPHIHATLPDLAVARTACGGGIIDFDIRNSGRASAQGFTVAVRDPGGAVVKQWTLNTLRGGDQRNFRFKAQAGIGYTIDVDEDRRIGDPNRGDNTRLAQCGGGAWNGGADQVGAPDLVVTGAQCRGERVRFQVRNQGTAADGFDVVLQGPNGGTAQSWHIPGLAQDGVRSFTYTRTQSGTFRITADPFRHVNDDVRANNVAQLTCGNNAGAREIDLAVLDASCRGGTINARVGNTGRGRADEVEMVLKTSFGRIVKTRTFKAFRAGRVVEIALQGDPGQRYILEMDPAGFVSDIYRGNNKKVVRCGN